MLLLITYDVSTVDRDGKRRLRKVSRECMNYGQRVQNSVFECQVDASQFRMLQHKLEQLIDPSTDSLRFYNLGNQYKNRVVHIGAKETFDVTDVLIL